MASRRFTHWLVASVLLVLLVSTLGTALEQPRIGKFPKEVNKPQICPRGCYCLTEEEAKEKFRDYTRCTEEPCGYELVREGKEVKRIPKYCFRPTQKCPSGCNCLPEEFAKEMGLELCMGERIKCDENRYCFKIREECHYDPQRQRCIGDCPSGEVCREIPSAVSREIICKCVPICPEDCKCLSEEEVKKYKEEGLELERCKAEPCGYTETQEPKYCFRVMPPCPRGCYCLTEEEAKERNLRPCKGERIRCGEDKYCFEVREPQGKCPKGCECLSKDEGYELGMDFCMRDGSPIICEIIDAEHGIYKYCFKMKEECHYDPERQRCIGDCPPGTVCTGRPSARCLEECKLKFEECLEEFPEEECEKTMEECRMNCPLECECVRPEICPEDCKCLSEEEVKKYKEEGLELERCKAEPCGYTETQEPKYCFRRPVEKCHFDYKRNTCVGICPEGEICHLNTIRRDPETGEVLYGECTCKAMEEKCPEKCECLTREEAVEKFKHPALCKREPCGREMSYLVAAPTQYKLKYCFREASVEECRYDPEKRECIGGCAGKGVCTKFEDAYGRYFCKCISISEEEAVTVFRILPEYVEPFSCFPVRLIVRPKPGISGIIITEEFSKDLRYAGSKPSPDRREENKIKWLLRAKEGVKEQEIVYKLCVPATTAREYYFSGGWKIEGTSGRTEGDESIGILPSQENWPPCPVSDEELLKYVESWSRGELDDLSLLQVIESWASPVCGVFEVATEEG